MAAHYTAISIEDFEAYMLELAGTHKLTYRTIGGEAVYSWEVEPNLHITIYSSITEELSRPSGEDAIRVVLLAKTSTELKPVGKYSRVNRVANWRHNLKKRIAEVSQNIPPMCPVCSIHMRLRTNTKTKQSFYGCLDYPLCHGTRSV